MLKINVDYSEDAHHDQLVRNAYLQLCLSILNHMGFRGEFKESVHRPQRLQFLSGPVLAGFEVPR